MHVAKHVFVLHARIPYTAAFTLVISWCLCPCKIDVSSVAITESCPCLMAVNLLIVYLGFRNSVNLACLYLGFRNTGNLSCVFIQINKYMTTHQYMIIN